MVAADTKGSDILLQWRLHTSPIEARELREILLVFIATLPERQRIVAQCFIDNYEDFRERDTYRPLADAVSAITHVTESVAAVKSEWRDAREKIIGQSAVPPYGHAWRFSYVRGDDKLRPSRLGVRQDRLPV